MIASKVPATKMYKRTCDIVCLEVLPDQGKLFPVSSADRYKGESPADCNIYSVYC